MHHSLVFLRPRPPTCGANFRARDIFAFGEELRQRTQKDVDAFEIREVNTGTPFYESIMREGVKIA